MLDSVNNTRMLQDSGELVFFRGVKFKTLYVHISPIYLLIKDQGTQIFHAPILEGGGRAIQHQHLVL